MPIIIPICVILDIAALLNKMLTLVSVDWLTVRIVLVLVTL